MFSLLVSSQEKPSSPQPSSPELREKRELNSLISPHSRCRRGGAELVISAYAESVLTSPPTPSPILLVPRKREGVAELVICPSPSEERTSGRGVGVRLNPASQEICCYMMNVNSLMLYKIPADWRFQICYLLFVFR